MMSIKIPTSHLSGILGGSRQGHLVGDPVDPVDGSPFGGGVGVGGLITQVPGLLYGLRQMRGQSLLVSHSSSQVVGEEEGKDEGRRLGRVVLSPPP